MRESLVVGPTLLGGSLIFTTGAVLWRLAFQAPLAESLPAVQAERGRHTWIHAWMLVAMFVTPAGIVGFAAATRSVVAAMAAAVYLTGAASWIVSLTFRLTVLRWAADQTTTTGTVPSLYVPFDAWAGGLYVVHMASAYVTFAVLGAAVLVDGGPGWLGWLGVGLGVGMLAGFVATRFAGPFNPPILAHTYTGVLGVWLLTQA